MAVLAFQVKADYEEAIECRNECKRLENEMISLTKAGKDQTKEFDDLSDKYYATSKRLSDLATKAAEAAYYMGPEFKKALADSKEEVLSVAEKLKHAQDELQRLKDNRAPWKDISDAQEKVAGLSLQYTKAAENQRKLEDGARKAGKTSSDAINDVSDALDELGGKVGPSNPISQFFNAMSGKIAAAFSVAGIKAFLGQVYTVRSYFQDIESSMEVFLGSEEKAKKFTNDLKDYAYYNMFEFADLADASKQLIAYGNEVDRISGKGGILDQLSNIAKATNQPLMSLVNSWNKAKNVGFVDGRDMQSWAAKGLILKDVLKEMGEKVNGNKVSFEQLQKAIAHVTQEGQMFGGIMDKMMPNLSSSMGQLQDNLKSMWNDIGETIQKPMHDAIDYVSSLVSNYKEVGKTITQLIAVYGSYRAALMVVNALKTVERLNNTALAASETNLTLVRYAGVKAQKALNKSILTNPYILATMAIMGVVTAMVRLNKESNLQAGKQGQIAKVMTDAEIETKKETRALDELYAKMKTAQKGSEAYEEAKKELIEQFGPYRAGLAKELDQVNGLETAYNGLTEAIRASNRERAYQNARNNMETEAEEKISLNLSKLMTRLTNKYGTKQGLIYYEQLSSALDDIIIKEGDINKGTLKNALYSNETIKNFFDTYYGKDWGLKDVFGTDAGYYIKNILQLSSQLEQGRNALMDAFTPEEVNKFIGIDAIKSIADEKELDALKTQLESLRGAVKGATAGQSLVIDVKPQLSENVRDWTDFSLPYQQIENEVKDNFPTITIGGDIITIDSEDIITRLLQAIIDAKKGIKAKIENDNDAEERAQRSYNARKTREQNAQNLRRTVLDSAFAARQSEISGMSEGASKELATLKLNQEKQAEQFKRQREDFVKKLNDEARNEWLAGDKNRKAYQFADQFKLVGDQIEAIGKQNSERAKNAFKWAENLKTQESAAWEAYQQSMDDFFDKYGTKAQQYEAMVKGHEESIREQTEALEEYRQKSAEKIKELEDKQKGMFNGNVDLNKRPHVPIDKVIAAGYEDEGGDYATVLSGQTQITDKSGKSHEILYTPILPNGEVLSQEAMDKYINSLIGSEDILKADTKGLIIGIDVNPDGTSGQELHEIQEELDNAREDAEKTEQAMERSVELATKQARIQQAQFKYDSLGGNGTVSETIKAREELLMAQADAIEDEGQKAVAIAKAKLEIAQMRYDSDLSAYSSLEEKKEVSEELYKLERQIYVLTGDRTKLLDLEKTHLKDIVNLEIEHGGNLAKVFGDVSKYTKEQLQNARATAKAYLEANNNLEPDQIKAIMDQLNAMDEAEKNLYFRGGNTDLIGTMRSYMQHRDQVKKVGDYEERITKKNNSLTEKNNALRAEKNAKLKAELELSNELAKGEDADQGKVDSLKAEISLREDRIRGLSDEATKLKDSIKQLEKYKDAEGELEQQQKALLENDIAATGMSLFANGINEASRAMKELAKATDNVALSDTAEELSAIGDIVSSTAQGFAQGGPYAAIAGFAISLIGQVWNGILAAEEATTRYNKSMRALKESMRELRIEETKRNGLDSVFGVSDTQQAENAISIMEQLTSHHKELVEEMRDIGIHMGADTYGGYWDKILNEAKKAGADAETLRKAEEDLNRLDNYSITTKDGGRFGAFEKKTLRALAKEAGVDAIDENGNLKAEFLESILADFPDMQQAEREFIEQALYDTKKYEEAIDELRSQLNSLFGDTASQLADATIEGLENGARIGADKMNEIMGGVAKNMRKQLVQGIYAEYLKTYTEDAVNIMKNKDKDTQTKNDELLKLYSDMFAGMGDTINAATNAYYHATDYAQSLGIDMEELKNAETGAQAYQNISETTGSAIEGRLTSLQISSSVKENLMNQSNGYLSELVSRANQQVTIAQDILSGQNDIYLALQAIKTDTANLYRLEAIENSLKTIKEKL